MSLSSHARGDVVFGNVRARGIGASYNGILLQPAEHGVKGITKSSLPFASLTWTTQVRQSAAAGVAINERRKRAARAGASFRCVTFARILLLLNPAFGQSVQRVYDLARLHMSQIYFHCSSGEGVRANLQGEIC